MQGASEWSSEDAEDEEEGGGAGDEECEKSTRQTSRRPSGGPQSYIVANPGRTVTLYAYQYHQLAARNAADIFSNGDCL